MSFLLKGESSHSNSKQEISICKGGISMSCDKIRIILLGNEGILIEYKNTKLLVDALHDKNSAGFSSVPSSILEDLLLDHKPFDNINYVLFTHYHSDHFSSDLLKKYLLNRSLDGLFIPQKESENYTSLSAMTSWLNIPTHYLNIPLYEKQSFILGKNIKLTCFNSVHAGDQFAHIENYCYLITLGEKTIFIIGDADYKRDYFGYILMGSRVDTLLVNPLYINNPLGRNVVAKINPSQLIIYHIPFKTDDTIGFRNMVKHDLARYQNVLPKTIVLQDELQEILI